jgi:hypothetical protein
MVLEAVLNSQDAQARGNLRPLSMAQATPRVFWNVVRHGAVGPTVNFQQVRSRSSQPVSQPAAASCQQQQPARASQSQPEPARASQSQPAEAAAIRMLPIELRAIGIYLVLAQPTRLCLHNAVCRR